MAMQSNLTSPFVLYGCVCGAPGCENTTLKQSCLGKAFFTFPLDETRCRQWVLNCGRLDLIDKSATQIIQVMNVMLCADHFTSDQFDVPGERASLVSDAIPTLFAPPSPGSPMHTLRQMRIKNLIAASTPSTTERSHYVFPLIGHAQTDKANKDDQQIESGIWTEDDFAQPGTVSLAHAAPGSSAGNRAGSRREKSCCWVPRINLTAYGKIDKADTDEGKKLKHMVWTRDDFIHPDTVSCTHGFKIKERLAGSKVESHGLVPQLNLTSNEEMDNITRLKGRRSCQSEKLGYRMWTEDDLIQPGTVSLAHGFNITDGTPTVLQDCQSKTCRRENRKLKRELCHTLVLLKVIREKIRDVQKLAEMTELDLLDALVCENQRGKVEMDKVCQIIRCIVDDLDLSKVDEEMTMEDDFDDIDDDFIFDEDYDVLIDEGDPGPDTDVAFDNHDPGPEHVGTTISPSVSTPVPKETDHPCLTNTSADQTNSSSSTPSQNRWWKHQKPASHIPSPTKKKEQVNVIFRTENGDVLSQLCMAASGRVTGNKAICTTALVQPDNHRSIGSCGNVIVQPSCSADRRTVLPTALDNGKKTAILKLPNNLSTSSGVQNSKPNGFTVKLSLGDVSLCTRDNVTKTQAQTTDPSGLKCKKDKICEFCGKTFTRPSQLRRHIIITHEKGEKKFECATCSLKFYTKGFLRSHMISHSTLRPFKCLQCSKTFKTNTVLKNHQMTHFKGVKRYWCNLCDRGFKWNGSLNLHNRQNHPPSPS